MLRVLELFESFVRVAPVALVGLMPAAVIPLIAVPAGLQKGIIAGLVCGVILLVASVLVARSGFRLSFLLSVFGSIFVAIAVVALVSGSMHVQSAWQLFGVGLEVGTVAFFVVLLIAYALGFHTDVQSAVRAMHLWVTATAFTTLAALVVYVVGSHANVFTTLMGEWPQLSFGIASALLVIVVRLDSGLYARLPLQFLGLFLAVSFVLFLNSAACIAFVGTCVLYATTRYVAHRHIALHSIVAAGVFCALLIFGIRGPVLDMPPFLSPSVLLNEVVASSVYEVGSTDIFFGVGPGQFSHAWERVRPVAFNQTPLWEDSFWNGYSTFGTIAVELGFFGVLAYLCACLVLVGMIITRMRTREGSTESDLFLFFAFFALLMGVVGSIQVPLLLAAAFFLGALHTPATAPAPFLRFRLLAALLLACIGIFLVWVSSLQLAASHVYVKGVAESAVGEVYGASEKLEKAVRLWPADLYARDASRALAESAFSTQGDADMRTRLARAVTLSDESIHADPQNYWNWISRAGLMVSLVRAGFLEVRPDAEEALRQAHSLSPSRVEPLYLSAVYARAVGSTEQAALYIEEALTLKADYEPALVLKKELDVTLSP